MKVGDYVRFDGEIAKIRDIKRYKTKENIYVFDRILDLNEDRACNENIIYNSQWKYFDNVKSSPNIIDLIEVGDYVDKLRVVDKYEDYIVVETFDERIVIHKEDTIKSVLTKEMFEQMEYKVGEIE